MEKEWRNQFYDKYSSKAAEKEYLCSKKEYDMYAKIYQHRFSKYLPKDKGARILDIACGSGHFVYYLQAFAGYINSEGIDVSSEQIEIAVKNGINNVYQEDVKNYLKNRQECYDLITAHHLIEHLTKNELLEFLKSIQASLKKGGRLIVSTGNVFSLFGASHICADFTHEGGFTPRSLMQLLKTMNFENVVVDGLGPIAFDFKSKLRVMMWSLIKRILLFYLTVERGKGRLKEKENYVLELDIMGTGVRKA